MKYIKLFEQYLNETTEDEIFEKYAEENIADYRDAISKGIFPEQPSNQSITNEINQLESIKFDVKNTKIKVFLDITSFLGKNQDNTGRGIILFGAIKNWLSGKFKYSAQIVNHIGFIFSDGRIFHATGVKNGETHNGIAFETGKKYEEIISDPTNYMVYEISGDEKTIEKLANNLLNEIDKLQKTKSGTTEEKGVNKPGAFYDKIGLWRYGFGRLAGKEPENDLKFYCSELVSNLLVQAKVISLEELKSLSESLDKHDEVSPTELLNLVMKKGDPANLIIKYKDGENKVIDLKDYNID